MTFSELPLSKELHASVRRMGFDQPTPIQQASIPPALQGRDVLASAETGSGKTAAFLLPIMNRLLPMQRGATRALVLAPTRELAAQIADHFKELAAGTSLTCAAVYGGVGMGNQERAFRKGVDMIVACPGRLLDHMRGPFADFSSLQHLVLDEADRMLDMGFLPDIRKVLARVPKDRQTLFFSATMPSAIVELAGQLLRNPVKIDIDRKPAPVSGLSHAVYPVSSDRKQGLLLELLAEKISGSVLIFTRTKHRANRLADFLDKNGVRCDRIHGNRSQSQRTSALAGFKSGSYKVLVATDIAARGIDVEALGSVVNFDVPHVPEDYIHRVGRTARAQLTGDAYTLLAPEEERDFSLIERSLGKRLPRHRAEGFDYAARPAAEARTERASERQPRDQRGAGGSRRSPAGEHRPFGGERRPSSGERHPAAGGRRPSGDERRSFGDERRPSNGERRPSNGERRPSSGGGRSFRAPRWNS